MSNLTHRRRAVLTVNRLIPNAVTLIALCAGMTGVRLALQERWELAVAAIVVAMVMDAMDGRIARLMSATSEFGAQLDSLSDVICFGVAPGLVVYLWTLQDIRGLGWAVALLYAICCALRLARFNTALTEENPPPWAAKFFTGVPAPGAAGLALLPMALSFVFSDTIFRSGFLNCLVLFAVAALMVSRVPTFSAKQIRVKRSQVGFVLLGVGATLAFLVSVPWITLSVAGLLYLSTIPMAIQSLRREKIRHLARTNAAASSGAAPSGDDNGKGLG